VQGRGRIAPPPYAAPTTKRLTVRSGSIGCHCRAGLPSCFSHARALGHRGVDPTRAGPGLRLRASRRTQPVRRSLLLPGRVDVPVPARRFRPRPLRCEAQSPQAHAITRERRETPGRAGSVETGGSPAQVRCRTRQRLGGLVPLIDPAAFAAVPLAGSGTPSYGGGASWLGGNSLGQALEDQSSVWAGRWAAQVMVNRSNQPITAVATSARSPTCVGAVPGL